MSDYFTLVIPAGTPPIPTSLLFTVSGGLVELNAVYGVLATTGSGAVRLPPNTTPCVFSGGEAVGTVFGQTSDTGGGQVGSAKSYPVIVSPQDFYWDSHTTTATFTADIYVVWRAITPGATVS